MISAIRPRVDEGSWPAKVAIGDVVDVEADVVIDGHDMVACDLWYAHAGDTQWTAGPMHAIGNDRWRAHLPITQIGLYRFVIRARPDAFETWRRDLRTRIEAGQEISAELLVGASLLWNAAARAEGPDRQALASAAEQLRNATGALERPVDAAVLAAIDRAALRLEVGTGLEVSAGLGEIAGPESLQTVGSLLFSQTLAQMVARFHDPTTSVTSEAHQLFADRERARFSAWYELFPLSASPVPTRWGTLADVERRLGYVARLGFDVLYLPPIHPIGRTNRKGRGGLRVAKPGDPGSPWAIGAAEGGHTAIHPELGTLDDLRSLIATAAGLGIDVAMDLAFQASPDHPWVHEHPEWFRRGPDGTIRHAENPPKKYEDIYPLDFDTANWPELWRELLEVARFWVAHGVRIFRVDNPHTKPLRFWEWFIASLKAEHPELIFLAEAFTRPKMMYQLAKLGFTQSYTYFAWRSTKWELESYFTELTGTEVADYFRPNLWPNTPDILTEQLQSGGTGTFIVRLVLAATLGASYGIYGPAFELQEHVARQPGSEEYSRSEKYEVRQWALQSPDSLADLISLINQIRRAHPALQTDRTLRFHPIDNEQMVAYSKRAVGVGASDVIVVVVNLDPVSPQSGWVQLDLRELGVAETESYVMHDLLTNAKYRWEGASNYVRLDPAGTPVHVFAIEPASAPR
jgi:starch synthase (maltosyl-transferring)